MFIDVSHDAVTDPELAVLDSPIAFWPGDVGAIKLFLDPSSNGALIPEPYQSAIFEHIGLAWRLFLLNDELRNAQDRLVNSEKLAASGKLSASIAHDIRNIVTPMNLELSLSSNSDFAKLIRA